MAVHLPLRAVQEQDILLQGSLNLDAEEPLTTLLEFVALLQLI